MVGMIRHPSKCMGIAEAEEEDRVLLAREMAVEADRADRWLFPLVFSYKRGSSGSSMLPGQLRTPLRCGVSL